VIFFTHSQHHHCHLNIMPKSISDSDSHM
jgi:hypothetical protein